MFDCVGLDWGSKYIGVAIGQSSSKIVIPKAEIYETHNFDLAKILDQCKTISTIVIGLPSRFDTTSTKTTVEIQKFIETLKLRYPEINIKTVNENNTSKIAQRQLNTKNQKSRIDNLAALNILKIFFETIYDPI
jgi:putative holliday junction resolvase